MYLLDTNVISELRRAKPNGMVLEWLSSVPDERLFLSAVTIGEVQAGIEIAREQDAAKAQELEDWLDNVPLSYEVLPADAVVFRVWARFMHHTSDTLIEDALIAATAAVHNLVVVTRNTGHFSRFDVEMLNPFVRMVHEDATSKNTTQNDR